MKRYFKDLFLFLRCIKRFLFDFVPFLSISGEEAVSFPSLVWKILVKFMECSPTTTCLGQRLKLKMQTPRSVMKDQAMAKRLN